MFVVEFMMLLLTPSARPTDPPSACDTPSEPLMPTPSGAALKVAPPLTALLQFWACEATWLSPDATPCVVLVPDEELLVSPIVCATPATWLTPSATPVECDTLVPVVSARPVVCAVDHDSPVVVACPR